MKEFISEKDLALGRMSSGRLYLELTTSVGWEGFPSYAEALVKFLSGAVVSRNDSADTRVWVVVVEGILLWLVYDDLPVMISFEAKSDEGDRFLQRLNDDLFTSINVFGG